VRSRTQNTDRGGLDPLQTNFQANPTNLANNRSTKLGTLICSALARTVRPQGQTVRQPSFGSNTLKPHPIWHCLDVQTLFVVACCGFYSILSLWITAAAVRTAVAVADEGQPPLHEAPPISRSNTTASTRGSHTRLLCISCA
jgi:hypothetical protein